MKIAIEAQRIFRKEKHGMDYVALETIRELQKIDQQNEYFIPVSYTHLRIKCVGVYAEMILSPGMVQSALPGKTGTFPVFIEVGDS